MTELDAPLTRHMTRRRDEPRRLTEGNFATDANRLLSQTDCETLARRIFGFAKGREESRVGISSWWQGELRWARNRVSLASDRRNIRITIMRRVYGRWGFATTNQTDDVSLEDTVRAAELQAFLRGAGDRIPPFIPPIPYIAFPKTTIWSDATYDQTTEARGEVVRAMIKPAEAKGMMSAGYLEVRGATQLEVSSERPTGPYPPWDTPYVQWTQAQLSTTVRDPEGTASGWAGLSSYNWSAIDSEALGQRALEKCLASRNPVAIEPGRYTVILEPQAVADLLEILVGTLGIRTDRRNAENGFPDNPWTLGYDDALRLNRSKLGLKVVDERITISHDPTDPHLGILPDAGMQPVIWIDHGVLMNLGYDRGYALAELNQNAALRGATGYRMSGGDTTIDEMIRTTKRGFLVTRFWDVQHVLLDGSLLLTGLTRDGVWLVENGKITKAIKNFRFTESPLFVLNSVEQLGPPERVFRPTDTWGDLTPAIVPPLKARDFSFTSLVEAI